MSEIEASLFGCITYSGLTNLSVVIDDLYQVKSLQSNDFIKMQGWCTLLISLGGWGGGNGLPCSHLWYLNQFYCPFFIGHKKIYQFFSLTKWLSLNQRNLVIICWPLYSPWLHWSLHTQHIIPSQEVGSFLAQHRKKKILVKNHS